MGDKSSTGNGCLTWDQQAGEWDQWLSDIMSQPCEAPDTQTITDTSRPAEPVPPHPEEEN